MNDQEPRLSKRPSPHHDCFVLSSFPVLSEFALEEVSWWYLDKFCINLSEKYMGLTHG